jgi:membrane fusion protein (multidrug efflux system)
MTKRMIVMLVAVAAFLGIIGTVKFRQIQAGMAMAASFQPPPEAVTTTVAQQDEWPASLGAIGSVVAVRGVTVSADLAGIVESITFESGRPVAAGTVLVRLDTKQEQAQLAAAESQRDLAKINLERARELAGQGVIAQSELDRTSAEHEQAVAKVGEIRATIERKQIRAPFAGVLGIRQVNLGQFLNGGDPVVALQAIDPVYVNFSVPQQDLGQLRIGLEVSITSEGLAGAPPTGRITAIDSVVNEATRNIEVQATLANPGGRLRPGTFVKAQVAVGTSQTVVALPASAISYAPYGDSVFVVGDLDGPGGKNYRGVRQQFVKLGGARGDQVAVVSGLKAGDEVVTSGAFKLRTGAAVHVRNETLPANETAPKPEDN